MIHWLRRDRGLFLLPAILLLWSCVAQQVPSKPVADFHALNQSGIEAYNKGDYQTAIGFYREALAQVSSDPDIWNNLGNAYYNSGNYKEAVSAYIKALEIRKTAAVWVNLGNTYYAMKGFAEALDAYNRGLAIAPADERGLYWRGWTYYQRRDYNNAIVDFDRVVGSKNFGTSSLDGRGMSFLSKGLYKEAIQDFSAALKNNPKYADALSGRGWAYYYTGSFKEAIKDFGSALEVNTQPENMDWINNVVYGKALAYLGVGDRETAVYLIENAQASTPFSNWLLMVFYYLSGDKEKAWQFRGGEGMIGVAIRDNKNEQVPGAKVTDIEKNSPAEQAGFLEGDVIIRVNAMTINGADQCVKATAALRPGTVAEVGVWRENREKKIQVRIGSVEPLVLSDPKAAPLIGMRTVTSRGGDIPVGAAPPEGDYSKKGSIPSAADELY